MRDRNTLLLLWSLPIALSLHVLEEFAFPGGFRQWIKTYQPGKLKSDFYYFIVNAIGILVATTVSVKASEVLGFRIYLYSVALMAGNAATHIRETIQRKRYCPGTISGGLLLLPLCVVSYWFFLSEGKVDLFSAVFCVCVGLVAGFYAVGVDTRKTQPKWNRLSPVLIGVVSALVLMFFPAGIKPTQAIDVYDGFESGKLSTLWETSRFVPGAVEMQTNIFRAGGSAAKVIVHAGDKFEAGIQGNSDSERAELLEARQLTSLEDAAYEYSFSIFLPTNFPIVPTRLVIAQWKQACPDDPNCSDDSPVLAIRYMSGALRITQNIGKGERETLYQKEDEFRGRWLDFKFQIRFATNETGRVKAWLGDKQLVDFTGVTANPENEVTGYRHPGRFYFKMGLYRNVMPEPMTVYIDEYRKRQLPGNAF